MKKLIVIHYHDEEYDVGGLVRFLIKIFNDEYYKKLLKDNYGLDTLTSRNIHQQYQMSDIQFLNAIKSDNTYSDSTLLGMHPYGIETILSIKTENQNRFKFAGWINDPHYFAYLKEPEKEKIGRYTDKIYPIPALERLDYMITPSKIYFKNLNITEYDHKLVDFFYLLNPAYFKNFLGKKYADRKSEVILSGAIGGYTSRVLFNKLRLKSPRFKKLIYKLNHPGRKNNAHMTELNYYLKLSEYKGAFVGHHDFPINYLLAKHIEVLMCGCLAFFEPNPLLESQLGLKENVHYISCFKNGNLIENYNFYKNWMDGAAGEAVAKSGQEYVMNNFGEKYIYEFFNLLKDR